MACKAPTSSKACSYADRRRKVLAQAGREAKIDALLVTRPEDVSYFTGFTGDDSYLLTGAGWAALLTDGRYGEQAPAECPDVDVYVRQGTMSEAVGLHVRQRRVRRLGVLRDYTPLGWRKVLAEKLARLKLAALGDLPGELRMVKDKGEIQAVLAAIRIAERAFTGLMAGGRKALLGRTERQVAAELEYRMRLAGADKAAFDTIVAAGANASKPHHRSGDDRIGPDTLVLFDWGARKDGYISDLTRVVMVGRIPPKLVTIYDVVQRAQSVGMAAIRAGISAKTAYAAAKSVIDRAGYGPQFVHGLGHGIGRFVHEGPSLSRLGATRLKAGMVVTVEPGIYLPGVGGVRIEDDVLVTAKGCRRLSRLSRRWQV